MKYQVINTWSGENCEADKWEFNNLDDAVKLYNNINLKEEYRIERDTAGWHVFGERTISKSIELYNDNDEYVDTFKEETYSKEQFESEQE